VKNKLLITAELFIKIFVKEKLMIEFLIYFTLYIIFGALEFRHIINLNAFITAMTKSI